MDIDDVDEASAGSGGADSVIPCKVLLVDDDLASRMSTVLILEDLGYTVIAVPSAEEAIEKLAEAPHVLLTDINLGKGRRGDDLAREMVRRAPGLAVVFMSGLGLDADAVRVDGAGPATVLAKPFEREELHRAIEKALRGESAD